MRIRHLITLLLFTSVTGCDSDDQLNSGIVELPFDGGFIMGVWKGNAIFGTWPLQQLELGESYKVVKDTSLPYIPRALFIEANDDGSRLLIIESKYPDVCLGSLYELEVDNRQLRSIVDTSYNISSGLYVDDSIALVYSYGSSKIEPGYHRLNLRTSEFELIMPYTPEIGAAAVLNGFDYDPNNSVLYYTLYRQYKTPKIITFNLSSKRRDTLDISFDGSDVECLWIRLNTFNNKILYCQHSRFALTGVADTKSEIGIIDLLTRSKRVLPTNPFPGGDFVSIAAHWSPDERYILYGAGELLETGESGLFHAFIKEVSQ